MLEPVPVMVDNKLEGNFITLKTFCTVLVWKMVNIHKCDIPDIQMFNFRT